MSESNNGYRFGMVGLGTMGRNLLLNMSDHGFSGAGFDKDGSKATLLEQECRNNNVKGFTDSKAFVASLQKPRAIVMLVPAGKIVDSVIQELTPLLDKGDILVDGGNSHFTDTNRRVDELEKKGIHFFGMGISGGEEGARFGPSMMPGGDKEAYAVMKPVLEAIAAKVDGVPCVTYIGPGASGHFVKMVHNGIEYGLMQQIAEAYGMMKNGLQMNDDEIGAVFAGWNNGRLQSFLMEITKDIFQYKEPGSDHLLVEDIKDEAKAKGTGKWTSQVAMDLGLAIPTIDMAVSMRELSENKKLRVAAAKLYDVANKPVGVYDKSSFLQHLENAFYFSMIVTYSQGLHLLSAASAEYNYDLDLSAIARIWRGGCIIRSVFLNDIYNAYNSNKSLPHLLLDEKVAEAVKQSLPGARKVVAAAVTSGVPMPGFADSLSYFDSVCSERMPSNLIQAQRDYFGAHTYELTGKEGVFHTQWVKK